MPATGNDLAKVARSMALARLEGITPQEAAIRLYAKSARNRHICEVVKSPTASIDSDSGLQPQSVTTDFVDALRPLTVIGRLPYRPVPFTTQLPFISGTTTFDFFGETISIAAKAIGSGTPLYFAHTKIGGIIVVSNELLKRSQVETVLKRDMMDAVIQATDSRLLDPASDDDSGNRPAAITYGATEVDGTGAADADDVDGVVGELISTLVTAGSTLQRARFVTQITTALAIGMLRTTSGEKAFPGVNATGGELAGLPLITSASAPADQLTLVDADELLVADDGEAELSNSKETLLNQDDNPAGSSTWMSMFQAESTALRVVRFINWRLRRSDFVAYASNLAIPLPEVPTTA